MLGNINSPLDAQSSLARFLKDGEFSLPRSMTSLNVTIHGFLTSGLLHGCFFLQCEWLPSIPGWVTLGFGGRLPQLAVATCSLAGPVTKLEVHKKLVQLIRQS